MGCGRRVAIVLPIGALVASASCRTPTEIVVEVRAANLRADEIRGVSFYVGPSSEVAEERVRDHFPAATTTDFQPDGLIGTLGVVPTGASRLSVVVVAGFGRTSESDCRPPDFFGCIVARRSVEYIAHTITHLPITLTPECVNVPCSAASTCTHGACVTAEVQCSGDGCESIEAPQSEDGGALPNQSDARPQPIDGNVIEAALPKSKAKPGIECPPKDACDVGSHCCFDPKMVAGSCAAQCDTAGPATVDVTCDDRFDCKAGTVCCGNDAKGTFCSATDCSSVVCNDDDDCVRGSCKAGALWGVYGLCK